jgi:hypothetical protein
MGIQAGREGEEEAGGYWVKRGDASSLKRVPASGGEGRRRRVVGEARAAGGKKGVAAVAKRKVGERRRRRVGKKLSGRLRWPLHPRSNGTGMAGPHFATNLPAHYAIQFRFSFFKNFQCALLVGQVSNFIHVQKINA